VTTAHEGGRAAAPNGGRQGPICFLVDNDFAFLREFSKSLRELGVNTIEFVSSTRLGENIESHNPDVVFINLNSADPYDCTRALFSLKECKFPGRVQLFGRCLPTFIESFRKVGSDASLIMLPALQKPIEFARVRKIVLDQKLSGGHAPPPELSLRKALINGWINFTYQPKIDLKRRQVVGAEAFVRLSHPQYGIVGPAQFLGSASEDDLADLATRALVDALKLSLALEETGASLNIAVNVSVETLRKLPVAKLVQENRPRTQGGAGIVFDVTETQALNRMKELKECWGELGKCGIPLAIDNFGRGNSSFEMFKQLPVSEIKIDRSFVHGCSQIKENSAICKSMIQLAHNFSIKAIAVGVEVPEDFNTLMELGCDVGQGYLFGKPTPAENLIRMVKDG
jgi:EAL domain-containing protein (putative c-di-GMP-specific phosphodiesterase class I)